MFVLLLCWILLGYLSTSVNSSDEVSTDVTCRSETCGGPGQQSDLFDELVSLTPEEKLWLLQRRAERSLKSRLVNMRTDCADMSSKIQETGVVNESIRTSLQNIASYAGLSATKDLMGCRAIAFQDDQFGGWSHTFLPGDHPLRLWPKPAVGNDISSLHVQGFCEVTLFAGPEFNGPWSATFTDGRYDMNALKNAGVRNDATNSIQIIEFTEHEKWASLGRSISEHIDSLLQTLDKYAHRISFADNEPISTSTHQVPNEKTNQVKSMDDPGLDCTKFLSCDDCFASGCGWCISDRICVPDKPWICLGEHDHVGSFSDRLVKQCPIGQDKPQPQNIEDVRPTSNSNQIYNKQSRDDSVNSVPRDISTLPSLACVGWHQTSNCDPGGQREAENDKTCDTIISPGNSGYCACTLGAGESGTLSFVKTALSGCETERKPWTCEAKCAMLREEENLRSRVRLDDITQRRDDEIQRLREEGITSIPSKDSGGEHEDEPTSAHCNDIQQFLSRLRANYGDSSNADITISNPAELGSEFPYEALDVDFAATPSTIRKAYRKHSLWLHPDKAPEKCKQIAEDAFSVLVAAYEILGDPESRELFDDFGEADQELFHSRWEWEKYASSKKVKDFYRQDPLITNLKQATWNRRVGGEDTAIWLVEFYAPWCKACQGFSSAFKEVANLLKNDDVDVGAVNCETEKTVCADWFAVPSYPTLRLVNRFHGMQQDYSKPDTAKHPKSSGVVEWVKSVSAEWRMLFGMSQVVELTPKTLNETLFGVGKQTNVYDNPSSGKDSVEQQKPSNASWFVLFTDGLTCGPCRTAKTNLMRLGAASAQFDVRVGFIDCSRNRKYCQEEHEAPKSPHAPFVKVWPRSIIQRRIYPSGKILYNVNAVESHVALEIAAKTVKLMATDEEIIKQSQLASAVAINGASDLMSNFSDDTARRKQQEDNNAGSGGFEPSFQWNGPRSRMAVKQIGSSGGGAQRRMLGGG